MIDQAVLVVEDEPSLLEVIRQMVEKTGHAVVACQSAEQAHSRYQNAPEDFCIVLTDLDLPGVSGITLSQQIRDTDSTVKIVWMTGNPKLIDSTILSDLCISTVLVKPFDVGKLRHALLQSSL